LQSVLPQKINVFQKNHHHNMHIIIKNSQNGISPAAQQPSI